MTRIIFLYLHTERLRLPAVRIQGIPQGIADEVDGHDEDDDQRAGRYPEPGLLGEHGQGLSTVCNLGGIGSNQLGYFSNLAERFG